MHVRLTTAIGMRVCDEETGRRVLGALTGIVLDPDRGTVEGFFVRSGGFFAPVFFLSVLDVRRFGAVITVRGPEVLCPPDDVIRVATLIKEGRPVLGQPIQTESGAELGTCRDVQFDTAHFMLEKIFPGSLLRWGTPLPANQILEVRPDAIIVRDTAAPVKEKTAIPEVPIIEMPEAA